MLEGGSEIMSKAIDQRIVEMSFENHKFEKGINQSKNSLKEFSNALNNMGNGKDFRGLEKSVNSISASFSMLEQIGIGALRRIGESAVNAGASLVKSLTIDQLSAGLDKYQQKIEAVQTMVSAGYDLEEVEKSMEQLMWFSDETSYSFADMANNMGKFISAGIDLKTSEKAMQGIATWAAHSGKNSQAASIAMFNLSQAISLGYVDTMNWRSIMNQNMNTKMFKEIAIGVAETTGAIKEGQVTIQNFDSNLRDKWFTNDVLLKTLEQYSSYAEKVKEVQDEMGFDTANQAMDYMEANADKYSDVLNQIGNAAFKASQESKSFMDSINATMDAVSTGWMKTYEIIFGTLYEAKENFSALTEVLWTVFASSAETRNEMLQLIKDGGGIKGLFKTIKNVAIALLTPLKAISQAFDQFFPPKTAEQWIGVIATLERVTKSLIMSEETAKKIQRTFAGFFAVVDIGWETVRFLGSALYEIVSIFIPLNGNLLEVTATVGDFLVELNRLIKQSGVFQYGLLGIKIAAMIVKDTLTNVVSKISEFVYALWTADEPLKFIGQAAQGVFTGILDTLKTVVTWISGKFKSSISSVFTFLSKGLNLKDGGTLSELLKTLKEFIEFIITEATGGLLDFGGALDKLDFNRIATFVSGGILLLFVNQLTNLTKSMNGLVTTTNSFVTKFSKKLFGTTTKIKDLAFVFGVLSASLYVLSEIPWEKMKVGLAGLSGALLLFVGAYGAVQAITVAGSKALNGVEVIKSAISLKALAAGMIGMTIALKQISKISEYDVWRSVGVLTALMGLVVAYQALSAVISLIPKQTKLLTDFGGVALGLATLVGVIAVLQLLTPEIISSGLVKLKGIMEVLMVLQIAFAVAALIGGGNKLSTSLFGISAGILALVGVIRILSELNISEMSKGIENVFLLGGILAAIQLMFSLAARISGGNKFKASIFSMTVGLAAMVALLAIMDSVGQKKLQNGIGTLTKMAGIIAGLEILTALAARIGGGHKLQKILGSVTLTMLSFTALIGIINFMTPETIDKGLATIMKMVAIILAFQGLVALTAVASKGATGGGLAAITGMVAGVLTVTAALILLSMQDQTALSNAAKNLAMTVAAVGIISTGIGLMIKSLSGLSTGLSGFRAIISKLLPGLAAMGVVLLATFALIELIKASNIADVSWNDLGKFIVGMGALTALATAFTILTKVPGLASGEKGFATLVPGLGGMALVVVATAGLFKAISFVLDDIKNIEWSDFGMFTAGLALVGVMALGIGALGKPLAALGPTILPVLGGVLTAIGGVALIVLGFAGLAAAMEALFQNDPEFLTRGIDKLVQVAEGIGRFFGALVSGFNKELMIGYGEGLAGFAATMNTIDPSSFDGVESLARALLILTGTSLIDGLARFVNFGKNPGEIFGAQISGMIKSLSGITAEDAIKTSNIIAALRPMTENLTPLIDAVQNIPNSGGLSGAVMGNNDIDDFGKQMIKFIKSFDKIDLSQVNHTNNIIQALGPMADNLTTFIEASVIIPNSGGVLGYWVGNNDIDDFGKQIGKFIKSFDKIEITQANHTTNIIQALGPMADSLTTFVEVASMIPNEGGWAKVFVGDNSIDDFGKSISKTIKIFGGIEGSQIQKASDNINLMANGMIPSLNKFITLTDRLISLGGNWGQSLPLLNLATTLKEFVKTLKGVDVSIVIPALKSLEDINASFKVMGAEVLASAKASFDNNTQPFQTSIITFLAGIIKEVDGRKDGITRSFSTIFTEALKVSKSYITEFKTLGTNIIKGLKQGIDQESPTAEKAINKVVKAVTTTTMRGFQINSPSKVFEGIGKWLPVSLGRGIERNTKTAGLAAINMSESVENAVRDTLGVHSLSDLFVDIGAWIPKSVGQGVEDLKGGLLNTAENLGIDTSKISIKGLTEELTKGEGAITSGITSLLELLTGSPTVTDIASEVGTTIGGDMTDSVRNALSDSKTGLGGSATKTIVKSELEKLQAILEEGKYYGTLSLEEELKAYEALRLIKGQTAEEYKKIDREVYRLVREIYEAQLSYIDEVTKAETESVEKRQELYSDYLSNKKTLTEESEKKLADIQTRYDSDRASANADTRKKIRDEDEKYHTSYNNILSAAEEERIRAREDYAAKQKSINDKLLSDIDAQNKAYENAVKSRADSIYNSYSLFSAVEEDPEVTGEELLKNLRDQGAALSEWEQSLTALEGRGVGDALIEELQQMGPASKAQIKALLELTDGQLDEYVLLFEGKYAFARVKAETELEGLKESTKEIIQNLNTQASIDLQNLESEFTNTMSNINSQMADDLSELKSAYKSTLAEINNDLKTKLRELKSEFKSSTDEVNKDTAQKLSKLEEEYEKSLATINTETKKKLEDLKTQFTTTMKTINSLSEEEFRKLIGENKTKLDLLNTNTAALLNTMESTYDQTGSNIVTGFGLDMQQLNNQTGEELNALKQTVNSKLAATSYSFELAGYQAAQGFANGIRNGSYMAISAAESLANQAVSAARRVLDERSPSRVFAGIGKFVSLGFANGISEYAYQVEDASEKMANGPIAAVSQALANLDSELGSDVWEPVITPVLDLSNIRNNGLDRLLGLGKDIQFALGSSRLASETIQNGNTNREPETLVIHNNFDLTGLTVRTEADIDLIATKLHQKQQSAQRGRGLRTLPTGR